MIFQPEFPPQRPIFSHNASPYNPNLPRKCMNLSKEERMKLRKQEKRRRQIQELRSGCRRFMAMLFSHIGLSGLVIAYTIIGAILFGRIEKEFELEIKKDATYFRKNVTLDLMEMLVEKLQHYAATERNPCTTTSDLLNSIKMLIREKRVMSQPTTDEKVTLNDSIACATVNCTELDVLSQNITVELTTTAAPINPFHVKFFKDMEYVLGEYLRNYTKHVSSFMEDKGWNASEQMEDLKWSFAGAVLYAITVITTIGYGYTTPRTDAGKILTIFYALIGIPLVFLYLSNIGDYLADVFRALYSRTCRTGCENYCSISILTSMFQTFIRRFRQRKIADSGQEDENAPADITVNTPHWQYRRRKRVLLKAIATANNSKETENAVELQKDDQEKNAERGHLVNHTTGLITRLKKISDKTILPSLQRINVSDKLHIPLLAENMKRAKSNLSKLMAPVTKRIQQLTQEFIFPAEGIVIQNLNTDVRLEDAEVVSPNANGLSPNLMGTQVVTAQLENDHESVIDGIANKYFLDNIPNVLPEPISESSIRTQQTMTLPAPVTQEGGLRKTYTTQPRYFTYDGQHRKFYLSARYLRSAERQRRHRRRMKQRMKEKSRSQINRLQNAMSYGNLGTLRKRFTLPTQSSLPGNTWEQLSLHSELPDDSDIRLLCWKDIDLDLEVRSIDDDSELYRLLASITKRRGSKPIICRTYERPEPFFKQGKKNSEEKKTTSSTQWQSVLNAEYSIEQPGDVPNSTTLTSGEPHTERSIPFIRTASNSESGSSKTLEQKEVPISRQSQSVTPTANRCFTKRLTDLKPSNKIHPLSSEAEPYAVSKRIPSCLRPNQTRKDTLDATVITNPLATLTLKEELKNRSKDRLSFTSTNDELDSEAQIELSYYSQEESVQQAEDDDSIFSFGEGFGSEEDTSNVTVPISFSLLIMTTYIVIGAVVFSIWEDKMYLKWSYFCFITLSTIGFGDIVPGTKIDSKNTKEKMVIISLYVAIGLSVFAMCFKLMQEEVVDKVKWFANKVGIIKKRNKKKSNKTI